MLALRRTEAFVVVSLQLEELLKVRLTVHAAMEGGVAASRECFVALLASKARLVVQHLPEQCQMGSVRVRVRLMQLLFANQVRSPADTVYVVVDCGQMLRKTGLPYQLPVSP